MVKLPFVSLACLGNGYPHLFALHFFLPHMWHWHSWRCYGMSKTALESCFCLNNNKKVVLIHLLRPPCGPSYAWLSMRPSVHQSILVLLHSASLPWRRRRRSFLLDPNPPHCKKGAQSRTTVKTIIKGHVLNVCWWDGWPGSSTDSENENFPHYLVLTHSLIVNVCRGRTFSKQCAKNVKTDADLAPFAKTIFH